LIDRHQLILGYRRASEQNPERLQPGTPPAGLRHAAVLVPVLDRPDGLRLLLTERAAHLKHHAGQISFPGGRVEAGDASPLATALREAEEEIGLRPNQVEVLGPLPAHVTTVSGFFIQPYLGIVHHYTQGAFDKGEVHEVFDVPLSWVLAPEQHTPHRVVWQGQPREFYEIMFEGHRIWGATAGMIVTLSHLLGLTSQPAPQW
jgi:8-oxo-dGTP pyrophosphatase MutT (NUDIX family)